MAIYSCNIVYGKKANDLKWTCNLLGRNRTYNAIVKKKEKEKKTKRKTQVYKIQQRKFKNEQDDPHQNPG